MIIELLTSQIPVYWDKIRTAGIRSDGIEPEFQEEYANSLLVDLLAGKKFCALSLDDHKELNMLFILGTQIDYLKKHKMLIFHAMFGFKKILEHKRKDVVNDCIGLCKRHGCVGMIGYASSPYVIDLLKFAGFKIQYTTMHYYI